MSNLSELIARLRDELGDADETTWTDDELTQHLRRALEWFNRVLPRRLVEVVETIAGQREYDISELGALDIVDVWHPYDADAPAYPLSRPRWSRPYDGTLLIEDGPEPSGAEDEALCIVYTAAHTIEGLDEAAETTLSAHQENILLSFAASFAARQAAFKVINSVTVSSWTHRHGMDWAERLHAQAMQELREEIVRQIAAQESRVSGLGYRV